MSAEGGAVNPAVAGILVVGRTGQVARELQRAKWPAGLAVEFLGRDALDLARPLEAHAAVVARRAAIVVNAAAYTAVDAAETDREMAFAVNGDGPAALAEACGETGASLIHLSTDYVFDGTKQGAYTEDDPINPVSVYGASKAAGEHLVRDRLAHHVILRTSWVYCAVGRNFLRTMLRLGAEREQLSVVDDQQGCPTSAAEVARAIVELIGALGHAGAERFGTFHFCAKGATTWYGFAREIFAAAQQREMKVPRVLTPIATSQYPTPARRPLNSVLSCDKISDSYGISARPWPEAVADCLDEIRGTG